MISPLGMGFLEFQKSLASPTSKPKGSVHLFSSLHFFWCYTPTAAVVPCITSLPSRIRNGKSILRAESEQSRTKAIVPDFPSWFLCWINWISITLFLTRREWLRLGLGLATSDFRPNPNQPRFSSNASKGLTKRSSLGFARRLGNDTRQEYQRNVCFSFICSPFSNDW